MKQSRLMSAVEAVTNVAVGFGVAVLTQALVFPLFGIHASMGEHLAIGGVFTVVSVVRSYALRRFRATGHAGSHANAGGQLAVAFDLRGREGGTMPEGPHDTANIRAASGGSSGSYIATRWAVRRLTPLECERLQGFPDGYTDVPFRKRNWTPDGPRYKALGNSMAVNAMEWLGQRIDHVRALL